MVPGQLQGSDSPLCPMSTRRASKMCQGVEKQEMVFLITAGEQSISKDEASEKK